MYVTFFNLRETRSGPYERIDDTVPAGPYAEVAFDLWQSALTGDGKKIAEQDEHGHWIIQGDTAWLTRTHFIIVTALGGG